MNVICPDLENDVILAAMSCKDSATQALKFEGTELEHNFIHNTWTSFPAIHGQLASQYFYP